MENERALIHSGFAAAFGLAMLAACGSGTGDEGSGGASATGGGSSDSGGTSTDSGGTSADGGGNPGGGGDSPGTGGLGGGAGGTGGGIQEVTFPSAQRLAVTGSGGCALASDDRVLCWGSSNLGPWEYPEVYATYVTSDNLVVAVTQLDGKGAYFYQPAPEAESDPTLYPFDSNETFAAVGANQYAVAGLGPSGTLTQELLGATNTPAVGPDDAFVDVHGALFFCGVRKLDGGLTCWDPTGRELSDDPCGYTDHGELSPPSGRFTQVAGGRAHFCAVRTDRTVACWGAGAGDTPECDILPLHWGQTAAPEGEFQHVCAGVAHSCAVRMDGTVACWGAGTVDGACGDEFDCGMAAPPPDDDFVQVGCGYTHSCGLKENGTVVCWGSDTLGRTTPPPELQP